MTVNYSHVVLEIFCNRSEAFYLIDISGLW